MFSWRVAGLYFNNGTSMLACRSLNIIDIGIFAGNCGVIVTLKLIIPVELAWGEIQLSPDSIVAFFKS